MTSARIKESPELSTMSLLRLAPLLALLSGTACSKSDDAASGAQQPATTAAEHTSPPALERTPAADGARVFFITPPDGAVVSSPVRLEFGLEGMAVVRSGDMTSDSGHHHVLIDTALPDLSLPIPADANHVHFGDASTSTELALDPGEHTLQLLLGDHLHIPHDPPVASERISIVVE